MNRLAQPLGVTALAVLEPLRAAMGNESGRAVAEEGAGVHVQAWPRGLMGGVAGPDRRAVTLVLTAVGSHAADTARVTRGRAPADRLGDRSEHRAAEEIACPLHETAVTLR